VKLVSLRTFSYTELVADEPNIILEHLRAIHADQQLVRGDLLDIKQRLSSLEMQVDHVRGDFAGQSTRIDRVEMRLERIERRLNLADA